MIINSTPSPIYAGRNHHCLPPDHSVRPHLLPTGFQDRKRIGLLSSCPAILPGSPPCLPFIRLAVNCVTPCLHASSVTASIWRLDTPWRSISVRAPASVLSLR